MRTVVFDLDGTLADTSADLIGAANAVFARRGYQMPLSLPRDYRLAHRGGRAMVAEGMARLALSDQICSEEAYQELLWCYSNQLCGGSYLYDGVLDCLDALQSAGYPMGICTNKPYSLARDLVTVLGIADYFDVVLGADSLAWRKPDPRHLFGVLDAMGQDVKNSVLIGDTVTDSKTAQAADIPAILVTFGPDGAQVKNLPAAGYIDQFDQLIPALEKLNEAAR